MAFLLEYTGWAVLKVAASTVDQMAQDKIARTQVKSLADLPRVALKYKCARCERPAAYSCRLWERTALCQNHHDAVHGRAHDGTRFCPRLVQPE